MKQLYKWITFVGIAGIIGGVSSCLLKEEVQGMYITGDYTTVIRNWLHTNADVWFIANFADSSAISYPAYLLEIRKDRKYAIFHVQEREGTRKVFYYSLQPNFSENTKSIEVKDLKMIWARALVNGVELVDPDPTKSVIVNGKLNK